MKKMILIITLTFISLMTSAYNISKQHHIGYFYGISESNLFLFQINEDSTFTAICHLYWDDAKEFKGNWKVENNYLKLENKSKEYYPLSEITIEVTDTGYVGFIYSKSRKFELIEKEEEIKTYLKGKDITFLKRYKIQEFSEMFDEYEKNKCRYDSIISQRDFAQKCSFKKYNSPGYVYRNYDYYKREIITEPEYVLYLYDNGIYKIEYQDRVTNGVWSKERDKIYFNMIYSQCNNIIVENHPDYNYYCRNDGWLQKQCDNKLFECIGDTLIEITLIRTPLQMSKD